MDRLHFCRSVRISLDFFFKSKREKEGFLFHVKICSKNAHFGPRKFGRMAAKV